MWEVFEILQKLKLGEPYFNLIKSFWLLFVERKAAIEKSWGTLVKSL